MIGAHISLLCALGTQKFLINGILNAILCCIHLQTPSQLCILLPTCSCFLHLSRHLLITLILCCFYKTQLFFVCFVLLSPHSPFRLCTCVRYRHTCALPLSCMCEIQECLGRLRRASNTWSSHLHICNRVGKLLDLGFPACTGR